MVKVKYDSILPMTYENCCICGTVKNCGIHLDRVFKNMETIGALFKEYKIFIYYDESQDDTLMKLEAYHEKNPHFFYYLNQHKPKAYRTHRLAQGRNTCLKFIRKICAYYKMFIMMDCDDVCSGEIHIEILKKNLCRNDWDSLSFNRAHYYDIWALSIRPYVFSYIHFNDPTAVFHKMKNHVEIKLRNTPTNEYLNCISAFNGFAIYRTQKFLNCKYDGKIRLNLIPEKYLEENVRQNQSPIVFIHKPEWLNIEKEDCEHRSFHLDAKLKNKARICISPEILFS